jgi:hypothetical protein
VVAAQLAVTSNAVGTFTTVTTEFPPIGGYYWRFGANQSIKDAAEALKVLHAHPECVRKVGALGFCLEASWPGWPQRARTSIGPFANMASANMASASRPIWARPPGPRARCCFARRA